LRRLQEHFPRELVVIGVHSAKFPSEKLTANIREAVLRHHIEHPVINDAGFEVWQHYTVQAWPTIVLIDAAGKYVGSHSGEIQAEDFIPIIEKQIAEAEMAGLLNRQPLKLQPEKMSEPNRPLSYPSKLLVTTEGQLFVADTGHHRILELALIDESRAEISRVFGSGQMGLVDGPAAAAAFSSPHGLALIDHLLYVADTDNHAIRVIDLKAETVRTVAGTGKKGRNFFIGAPTETPLRSPWALVAYEKLLLIAMAGSHQIWLLNSQGEAGEGPLLGPFAGNGREALVDGPVAEASFNQPSDLVFGLGNLFVADAEASAIRAISLGPAPEVLTLVGQGLFEFGDVDGIGPEARLQHPTGLAQVNGVFYIADSYNHKIKTLDPLTGRVDRLIGSGQAGQADGPFDQAQLFEPEGLAGRGDKLYIADTNNHLIRVADLAGKTVKTLTFSQLERLQPPSLEVAPGLRLEPLTVAAGEVSLTLNIELPAGYKLNPAAPLMVRQQHNGRNVSHTFENVSSPTLTFSVIIDQEIILDLTVYYCQAEEERLCFIDDARLVLPLRVTGEGGSAVSVSYLVGSNLSGPKSEFGVPSSEFRV